MAFSSREMLLILRARDEASRVLRGISTGFGDVDAAAMKAARNQISTGSSLVSLGAGFAVAGGAILAWMKGSVDQAVEFDNQVARVATQTDKVKVSQQDLGRVVKEVANQVAVPISELNDGLYDIFSSMDVNVPQAQHLLQEFAKEAVAGQVSLQDAGRATIGIMNAFHIPVQDVNKVLDVQFQLVRKGVGTFQEFATATGKVTPSATRAGQSIQTMAGMLAFMTRNGMTAQQASASAARAFDALSNPKVVSRLGEMGVHVKNAKGEFNQMGDVMVELQQKLSKLTAPERAAALQKLFAGAGGTIQARRFYDLVVKDQQSAQQFLGLVGDMNNASGAFTDAYSTMADTAASKSQVLQNRWQLVRIEVGQALMPVLMVLMDILSKVLNWWNSLGEGTKKTIIYVVAAGAALMVVIGVLLAVAGAIMMLSGVAAALGVSMGVVIAVVAGVAAAIAALIAIGWLIIANWDSIKAAAKAVWDWIVGVFTAIGDWFWSNFGARLTALWNDIVEKVMHAFNDVKDFFVNIWNDISTYFATVGPKLLAIFQPVVDWFIGIWDNVKAIFKDALDIIITIVEGAWEVIKAVFGGAWEIIKGLIQGGWEVIKGIFDFFIAIFTGDWQGAWDAILGILRGAWDMISGVFKGAADIIIGVVMAVVNTLIGIIQPAFDLIKNVIQIAIEAAYATWRFIWDGITGAFQAAWHLILDGLNALKDGWNNAWRWCSDRLTEFKLWVGNKVLEVVRFFKELPGKIMDGLGNLGNLLLQGGKDLVQGLINGIGDLAGWVKDKLMGLAKAAWQAVKEFFGFGSPSKLMHQGGEWIGQGLANGIRSQADNVRAAADFLANAAQPHLPGMIQAEDGSWVPTSFYDQTAGPGGSMGVSPQSIGSQLPSQVNQTVIVYTNEIDPRANAAQLGFELGRY